MDARPQINVDVVLHGTELWAMETVLRNTLSVTAAEREAADMLVRQCKDRDINSFCLKLAGVIRLCKEKDIRLTAAMRVRDEFTGVNWMSLYQLSLQNQTCLKEILFWSLNNETDNLVSTQVCSLIARIASVTDNNGWCNTWPAKVIGFICENLIGNTSVTLKKRVLQIFSEWSPLVNVLLVSVGFDIKDKFEAAIVGYLKEWHPTLSLAALEATLGYLPHLRRTGEENVFSDMVGGVIRFFDGALKDDREESIQEGLNMLIVLANRRPDVLMDDDLVKCLLGIVGRDNVESETVSRATDFLLVLAERGERSSNDYVRLEQLSGVFFHQLTLVEDDDEEEESVAYDTGREGIVRVAGVYGENGILAQAQVYHLHHGSSANWEERRAVIAMFDAIVEGCTGNNVMSFGGLKRVMNIGLHFAKDEHLRVKVAALNLILNLYPTSPQLYQHFKTQVLQMVKELLLQTLDPQLLELGTKVQQTYEQ